MVVPKGHSVTTHRVENRSLLGNGLLEGVVVRQLLQPLAPKMDDIVSCLTKPVHHQKRDATIPLRYRSYRRRPPAVGDTDEESHDLTGLSEDLVPLREQLSIRLQRFRSRNTHRFALEPLQTVHQHRTVMLPEDVAADLDDEVRTYSEDVTVERRVMKLAKSEAVRNARHATRVLVMKDVSGVEQFGMPEPANRAAILIGLQDASAKRDLV